MASRELERIRNAILDQRYTLTEHAYDEMAEDNLDVLDVESAILTGEIEKTLPLIKKLSWGWLFALSNSINS